MPACLFRLPLPPTAWWVHDLSPFLVRFSDSIGIRYYGLAYVAGFLTGIWLLTLYSRRGLTSLSAAQVSNLVWALAAGVCIGGRLGYFLFYQPGVLVSDPLALLRIWDGGMASHGGFIGVAVALFWFARSTRHRVLHLGDLVASVAPAGLMFGRIANFINAELWGKVSSVKWAVIFPESAPPGTPFNLIAPRHPSQLYAAVLEGLLPLILMQVLVWKTDWVRTTPGRLSGVFLVTYAISRMIGEAFREPDAGLILGLSRGTFYSIFVFAAGLALLFKTRPCCWISPPSNRSTPTRG
ncbi:prolipoprotein diacylglyceryl transferase [Geminisphaera colitermitum]|uniref:prolipoprotein diacylglyceryl transferase n=1 Tax=Geminisphaera colitermitum TaxID=1148786 RepID=UPI000158D424|nr:prolipoprotein diacylglyceryl transferase [Geminisphaera colitermitum]